MKRVHILATLFDRRLLAFAPTIAECMAQEAEIRSFRAATATEEFMTRIRAEFVWLSEAEIAQRHQVSLSTAKRWVARAFADRP
jgi:hypothetical protein